jgi:hypothetical protein
LSDNHSRPFKKKISIFFDLDIIHAKNMLIVFS